MSVSEQISEQANSQFDDFDSSDAGAVMAVAVDPLDGLEFERQINPTTGHSVGSSAANRQPTSGIQRATIPLYLDIETIPDESRMELFGFPPLPEIPPETSSANCPSPETLLEAGLDQMERELFALNPDDAFLELLIAEERKKPKPRAGVEDRCKKVRSRKYEIANAEAARDKEMGTTPEFCRIVAAGWAVGSDEPQSCVVDTDDPVIGERRILGAIWTLLRQHSPVVGFNVISFDLRVILFRSILLGVEPTRMLNLSRWSDRDVLDLQVVRYGNQIPPKGRGLKWLAKMNQIWVPAGEANGSDVAWLHAHEPEKLGEYVRSDVIVTRELHRRWQGYFCI